MADAEALERFVQQGRAVRRVGELQAEFKAANQYEASARVGEGPSTQREAAFVAGMSKRQEKTAARGRLRGGDRRRRSAIGWVDRLVNKGALSAEH